MKNPPAITIWIDESTDIIIDWISHNLIWYTITNSDKEEFDFMNKLKQARKLNPTCWTCLHWNEIWITDHRKLWLFDRRLEIFCSDPNVYFHAFLYRKDEWFISSWKTYEHYFAKQSVFSLALKMKGRWMPIQTMFSNVSTLAVLFDRRRAHRANVVANGEEVAFERFNELETLYIEEIKSQLQSIAGKDSSTGDFTLRFSFLSAECFDIMQFTDCLVYALRHKFLWNANKIVKIFDKHLLSNLDDDVKNLWFEEIYQYDAKMNIFVSNR